MNDILKACLDNASMEAIDYQKETLLFREMTKWFAILQDTKEENKRQDVLKKISAVIKHHTKATFNIHLVRDRDVNAFVFPPQSDSASPMSAERLASRMASKKMPSREELFQGGVDIKTGQVTGIFCDVPIDMFLSTAFLEPTRIGTKFAPEEIAAVMLHEMGHGIMYLFYLGEFALGNLVIAEIMRKTHEDPSPAAVKEVIKVAEQKTGYKLKDLGVTANGSDPLLIQQVVMTQTIEKIRSELGTKFYDARAFEFTADQYAARMGAGVWIVKALDRMYRECGWKPIEYRSSTYHILSSIAHVMYDILKSLVGGGGVLATAARVTTAGGLALALAGGIVSGLLASLAFGVLFGLIEPAEIYDNIPQRFQAMRRELIGISKNPTLTKAERQKLTQDIADIDAVLAQITENKYGPGFFTRGIAGMLNGRTAQMKFMRDIEDLANNRLFELSNTLNSKA